jgi:hypothetical protein
MVRPIDIDDGILVPDQIVVYQPFVESAVLLGRRFLHSQGKNPVGLVQLLPKEFMGHESEKGDFEFKNLMLPVFHHSLHLLPVYCIIVIESHLKIRSVHPS